MSRPNINREDTSAGSVRHNSRNADNLCCNIAQATLNAQFGPAIGTLANTL
jgi:hypothetical protein